MEQVEVTDSDREALAATIEDMGLLSSLTASHIRQGLYDNDCRFIAKARIEATQAKDEEIARLREALEPFAAMGRVMEARARITFGKVPKDSEIVCESSGEVGMGILTMGHFRDASALLPDAPGWGGVYKPLSRKALGGSIA